MNKIRIEVSLLDTDGNIIRTGTYVYNTMAEAMQGFENACDVAAEAEPDEVEVPA